MKMRKYKVTGMSCAACSARVEKAVKGVAGVTLCEVNLLTGTMRTEGGNAQEIESAVIEAGYGISDAEDGAKERKNDVGAFSENKKLILRLVSSLIFLIPLMYVSMGFVMWGFPLPKYFEANPIYHVISLQHALVCISKNMDM